MINILSFFYALLPIVFEIHEKEGVYFLFSICSYKKIKIKIILKNNIKKPTKKKVKTLQQYNKVKDFF